MEPRSFIFNHLKPLDRKSTVKDNVVVSNDNYVEVKEALEKEAFDKKKEANIKKGSQTLENLIDQ